MVAEVTFPQIRPGAVVIDHTWVDPSLRGQGAAGQLMQAVVDALRGRRPQGAGHLLLCAGVAVEAPRGRRYSGRGLAG